MRISVRPRSAVRAGLVLVPMFLLPGLVLAQREVAVERGDRLALSSLSGTLVIEAWDRDAVRLDRGEGTVQTTSRGGTVRVVTDGPHGQGSFHLQIPAWMALTVDGINLDVTVRDVLAPIRVETVNGAIRVDGGREEIRLESVSGTVRLENGRGTIRLESVHGNLVGERLAGEVRAETTNGSVVLRDVELRELQAESVNGDLTWDGPVYARGRYTLGTHNGSLHVRLPSTTDAVVTATSWHGDFRSDFPVRTAPGGPGRAIRFTLGSGGSARIALTTFQGAIVLERHATPPSR